MKYMGPIRYATRLGQVQLVGPRMFIFVLFDVECVVLVVLCPQLHIYLSFYLIVGLIKPLLTDNLAFLSKGVS